MKIETTCSTGERFPQFPQGHILWRGQLRDLVCDSLYPPLA